MRNRRSNRHRGTSTLSNEVADAQRSSEIQSEQSPSRVNQSDTRYRQSESARNRLHNNVIASSENSTGQRGGSSLFYGPSSHFAFLQQLYKEIQLQHSSAAPTESETQDGGPSLDMFAQKEFFFGHPSRISSENLFTLATLPSIVPFERALEFLTAYEGAYSAALPLFPKSELQQLIRQLYQHNEHWQVTSSSGEEQALGLAVLANGALCVGFTDKAELLFMKSRQTAFEVDDNVSLTMVTVLVLLSEYQKSMGRMHSAYLTLGTACRRAFAMGLHKDEPSMPEQILEKRRTTVWCLYVQEGYVDKTCWYYSM
jgi:hypothetical protein